jgi:hypothetical protein
MVTRPVGREIELKLQIAGASDPTELLRDPRLAALAVLAAEHAVVGLVGDRAVVEDVEQLVGRRVGTDLGDEDLHLHRLHLVGEDLAEDLGVLVGQAAGVDVVTAVLVALDVGGADAGHPHLVELVVAADAGEGDAVVDLADLAEVVRGVLRHEGHAVVVDHGHQRAAAGDALPGVVRPVLHHLLRRDVERHAHAPRSCSRWTSWLTAASPPPRPRSGCGARRPGPARSPRR